MANFQVCVFHPNFHPNYCGLCSNMLSTKTNTRKFLVQHLICSGFHMTTFNNFQQPASKYACLCLANKVSLGGAGPSVSLCTKYKIVALVYSETQKLFLKMRKTNRECLVDIRFLYLFYRRFAFIEHMYCVYEPTWGCLCLSACILQCVVYYIRWFVQQLFSRTRHWANTLTRHQYRQ